MLALLCGALTGCAAIPQIANIFFGKASETYPPGELYKYRGEVAITVHNVKFDGMAVTKQEPLEVRIDSAFELDRIQFTSCGRHDVRRDLSCGFFCKSKAYIYPYSPNEIESKGLCPLYIEIFSKKALASWGMVAFRHDETLQASMGCNGKEKPFAGYSVCQTKAGLDQSIKFQEPIEDFEADPGCNLKKINDHLFHLRPALGMCAATFYAKGKWHTLNLLGYDRVLVQGE